MTGKGTCLWRTEPEPPTVPALFPSPTHSARHLFAPPLPRLLCRLMASLEAGSWSAQRFEILWPDWPTAAGRTACLQQSASLGFFVRSASLGRRCPPTACVPHLVAGASSFAGVRVGGGDDAKNPCFPCRRAARMTTSDRYQLCGTLEAVRYESRDIIFRQASTCPPVLIPC